MTQSPITSTTPDALRAAIANAVQVDAQQLQAAVGTIAMATSDAVQATDPQIQSLYDSDSRTLTLLVDRIPVGQEVLVFAAALTLHLGQGISADLVDAESLGCEIDVSPNRDQYRGGFEWSVSKDGAVLADGLDATEDDARASARNALDKVTGVGLLSGGSANTGKSHVHAGSEATNASGEGKLERAGVFQSLHEQHAARNGQSFVLLGTVDPSTYDADDVGPMYRIKFSDGEEIEAYPDEVQSALPQSKVAFGLGDDQDFGSGPHLHAEQWNEVAREERSKKQVGDVQRLSRGFMPDGKLTNLTDPANMNPAWSNEHCEAAQREGWGIFETHGSDGGPWQIQRFDDASEVPGVPQLNDDETAWRFVIQGTAAHHEAARRFIRTHSPKEWAALNQREVPNRDVADARRVLAVKGHSTAELKSLSRRVSDVVLGSFSESALRETEKVLRGQPATEQVVDGLSVIAKALRGEDYVHHALQAVAVGIANLASGREYQGEVSNYIEQAHVVLTVTPDELGIVQAAVQEYRELIASPTSADREARGNEWADREVVASDALLDGKLAVAARRFQTSHEVSNYTGLTQDVLNALASEHCMTPGAISVSSDGTKSVVLERDDVDDRYCQAILTVHSSGVVTCHTGLYRERAIINNGSVTEPSVEVAIANASAVFDDLIVRHAEVRKEENYQSPGM